MSALNRVKKLFPQVTKVVDANKSIAISVSEADSKAGRKKDVANCALAKACKRQHIAEGAIIGLSVSYLINGTTATRYKTGQAVSREITSFDRHQDFYPGSNYSLCAVSKQERLGAQKHRGGKANGKGKKRVHHRTEGVRAAVTL